jgi:GNAT superfamily N-acetyltransferase
MPYSILGYHYTWWRGDPLPALAPLESFRAAPADDDALLAELNAIDVAEVRRRVSAGSQPYLAYLHGTPASYGWAARGANGIEELGIVYTLAPGDRDLWDFATLPRWRGRGVYPHLLQAILSAEQPAERFWIGHVADNATSGRGIRSAGFQLAGALVLTSGGALKFAPLGAEPRALAIPIGQHLGFAEPLASPPVA